MPVPTNAQAVFYFQFVLAAYQMYGKNGSDLTPPAQGFPDDNYKIFMWMNSLDPASGSRVFFGFYAYDQTGAKPSIIAIRGTDNWCEWMTDADLLPTAFPPLPGSYIATGFSEFYNDIRWIVKTGEAVDPKDVLQSISPAGVIVTGHSLGGAIATLLTATYLSAVPDLKLTLVTAASPAVGDDSFYTQFNALATGRSWRYINYFDSVASLLDPFYYQVDTAESIWSFDIWPTPGCEHSLISYIYILGGGSLSPDCRYEDLAAKAKAAEIFERRRLSRTSIA
jgi:triacylglycerol lipase